jgi:DNA-binding response OmpR family regulator
MKKKILVVEDDENIRTGLIDVLESEGFEAESAADGIIALKVFERDQFDMVLLDLMMPGKSGYDVAREIRAGGSAVPIIMLTAKSEEIDKVLGLELGADDYVTKPFGVRELLARVSALFRRSQAAEAADSEDDEPANFHLGPVEVDALRYEARAHGETHSLTPRELKLLRLFHARPDEALSRDFLLNEAWGVDYYGTTRTLDQHVAQLRKKVERDSTQPSLIVTVHGVGYRWRALPTD